jgi:PadR family transcriptional regulator, regulatory protein PadR
MSASTESLSGLPRAYLRAVLLLLLAEGPAHGYELLEQATELGVDRADPGGLYRCLRAMEQDGLVSSCWEPSPNGPARRTYDLTEEGLDWLHVWAGALSDVHRHLGGYLQRYGAVAGDTPAEARERR